MGVGVLSPYGELYITEIGMCYNPRERGAEREQGYGCNKAGTG